MISQSSPNRKSPKPQTHSQGSKGAFTRQKGDTPCLLNDSNHRSHCDPQNTSGVQNKHPPIALLESSILIALMSQTFSDLSRCKRTKNHYIWLSARNVRCRYQPGKVRQKVSCQNEAWLQQMLPWVTFQQLRVTLVENAQSLLKSVICASQLWEPHTWQFLSNGHSSQFWSKLTEWHNRSQHRRWLRCDKSKFHMHPQLPQSDSARCHHHTVLQMVLKVFG